MRDIDVAGTNTTLLVLSCGTSLFVVHSVGCIEFFPRVCLIFKKRFKRYCPNYW